MFVLVYVDDSLVTRDGSNAVSSLILQLNNKFSLKLMGKVNYFLWLEVCRSTNGSILLNQLK